MYIKNIKLSNFRNYKEQLIEFDKGINIFYGDNAQGKTNILEAIFVCAMGKSFRTKKDKELINLDEQNSKIEIEYKKIDRDGKIQINITNKKDIFVNGIKVKKLSELVGNINIVMFSPDDIQILKSGPANRRKFLDIMISQLRPNYLYHLNLYNKTLEQRNNYLRQINFEGKDKKILKIWDESLVIHAKKVYEYRKEFIEKIIKKINNIHNEITQNKENIDIKYYSDFSTENEYLENLEKSQFIDIKKGYTTKGIHRDDFDVLINNKKVNIYGSQGQHRTAILSLKISELQIVYDEIGEYPILLLDDFMSELDKNRIDSFIRNIKDTQVLITCTDKLQLDNLKGNQYSVISGKVK